MDTCPSSALFDHLEHKLPSHNVPAHTSVPSLPLAFLSRAHDLSHAAWQSKRKLLHLTGTEHLFHHV
jgi:hypothetical protein